MFNTVVTIQALSQSIYAREFTRGLVISYEVRIKVGWQMVACLVQSNLAKSWSKITETYKKCKN